MLLFDDQKKLTSTFTPEQAEVLAHILEKQAERQTERQEKELASKVDIALIQKDIEVLKQEVHQHMKELELKMTQRVFASAGVIIAVLGLLIKF